MSKNSILYIPHGGGPLPLFNHKGHQEMVSFLQEIPNKIPTPTAIIVISAHWENHSVKINNDKNPALLYDYSGFADEAYNLKYPAPGKPELAVELNELLQNYGIDSELESGRGNDHGMFVPLKLMYPEANIPCIQISLVKGLDPATHIKLGLALSALKQNNYLILGSGLSFHNMQALMSPSTNDVDEQNEVFESWLIDTCTNPNLTESEREKRLINWSEAPAARYCHPREEHLIPLHVCYGVAKSAAKLVFEGKVMGKKTSGYLW